VLAAALLGVVWFWRRRMAGEPEPPTPDPPRQSFQPPPAPLVVPPFDDRASPTVIVRRPTPGALPMSGTGPQPLLVAHDAPSKESTGKYCTACGMRLGPVHKFCGYCGHPIET